MKAFGDLTVFVKLATHALRAGLTSGAPAALESDRRKTRLIDLHGEISLRYANNGGPTDTTQRQDNDIAIPCR